VRAVELTTLTTADEPSDIPISLHSAADNPLSVMETRPRRQQTTEKTGEPLDLGIGTVHIERRNGSPILSARAYIQGKQDSFAARMGA
jgi:hypothetical protein